MWSYYVISFICGVLVACAEIISRYRDEPIKAICCRWGIAYIIFNALVSIIAFSILVIAGTVSETLDSIDNLKYSIYAGFGAAVIMRAKVFNLRLGSGERVSIGPDFVIDTLLNMLDRQIDRKRAYRRAQIVMDRMIDVDFERVKMPMLTLLTRSMQSITDSEMEKLGQKLGEITATAELGNQEKSYALGFLVLDLAGEDFFKNVFHQNEKNKYLVKTAANPVV